MWPAYCKAHGRHFEHEDVEMDNLKESESILLLEERTLNMQDMVDAACEVIFGKARL